MIFTTAVDHLLGLFQVEAQPVIGGVRFLLALIMFSLLASLYETVNNGWLDFRCYPETNDVLTQECHSRYSAEMISLIDPNLLVIITTGTLLVLWGAIGHYSSKNLQKIKKAISSKKEHLCQEFWVRFLLHICFEAVVIAGLSVFFCYTHTQMYLKENAYNCTLTNASAEIVVMCRDIRHRDKANLNIAIIGVMALILLSCIWTICSAICKKEEFIKDLVDLTTGNEEGREKLEINGQPLK